MGPRSRSRDCVCRHTGTNRRHFHSTEASGVLARVGRGCSARRVACCASGRRCCLGSREESRIRHSRACGRDGGIAFLVSGPASPEGSLQGDDARTWWNESDVGAERESSHRFFSGRPAGLRKDDDRSQARMAFCRQSSESGFYWRLWTLRVLRLLHSFRSLPRGLRQTFWNARPASRRERSPEEPDK